VEVVGWVEGRVGVGMGEGEKVEVGLAVAGVAGRGVEGQVGEVRVEAVGWVV
jgi:hypothetical protein